MKRHLERLLTTGALLWERTTLRMTAPEDVRHVLVLHFPVAVGIAMSETPLFEALRQSNPALRITVASNHSGLEVLRHSPYLDTLLAIPDPAQGLRAAVRALRGQVADVDCVLIGAFDRQRAVIRLAWLAARAWRGGFAEEARTVQRPLPYDSSVSVVGNQLRPAELLGWRGPLLAPQIYFTAAEVTQAQAWLQNERPTLLVVSLGSGPGSAWVPERMAEVLRFAHQRLGYQIVLDGGPDQVAEVDRLRQMVHGSVSLAGKTGLRQFAALAAASDLVLAVETGTMHVARAVGVPMLVLSQQWVNLPDWHPVPDPRVHILHGERIGPIEDGYCMEEFTVTQVQDALSRLAADFPPSPQARSQRLQAWRTDRDLLA